MALEDAVAAAFGRDGFAILSGLFSAAECRALKDEARRILEQVRSEERAAGRDPEAALASGVYVGLSQRSEVFRRFAADPRLLGPLRNIVGPRLAFVSDKVVFKDEHTEFDTPWHQDYPYWRGAHKYTAWVALDDATPDNGCLKLLPGSHRAEVAHDRVQSATGFGLRLGEQAVGGAVAAPVAAGGAVLFHDLTLHASFPNRAGVPRWAVLPTYAEAGALAAEMGRWPAARVLDAVD